MTLALFLLFVLNVNIATVVSKCFSYSLLRDLALNSCVDAARIPPIVAMFKKNYDSEFTVRRLKNYSLLKLCSKAVYKIHLFPVLRVER